MLVRPVQDLLEGVRLHPEFRMNVPVDCCLLYVVKFTEKKETHG
jgi:hypothetical protein